MSFSNTPWIRVLCLHRTVSLALALSFVTAGMAFGQDGIGAGANRKQPASSIPAENKREARVIESTEGGFRFRLPADFREPVKQNRVLAKGGNSFPAFLCLSDRGALTISPIVPPDGFSATPEILKQGALADLGLLKLDPEQERTLERKGESGFEIYAKGRHGQINRFARIQMIAAKHRWFEVCFISITNDLRDDPEIASVFESFEVLPATMIKEFTPETPKPLAYDSPDGLFKLELPAGFQQPIDQSALGAGSIKGLKARQYLASGPSGLLMMTRFYEIPGLNTKAQIAEARDVMANGIIESLKGKILSSKSLFRGGLAWQELRFTGEISGQVFNGRGRILGQKGQIHLFLYLSPSNETLDSAETEKFFDSIIMNP